MQRRTLILGSISRTGLLIAFHVGQLSEIIRLGQGRSCGGDIQSKACTNLPASGKSTSGFTAYTSVRDHSDAAFQPQKRPRRRNLYPRKILATLHNARPDPSYSENSLPTQRLLSSLFPMAKASVIAFVALFLLGAACKDSRSPTPTLPPTEADPLSKAQPRLPTMKLWLGNHEIVAELATTTIQQQTGMMFRTNMAEMDGMLFVFPGPHRAGFWMKNTRVPLDAGYIDAKGVIREIHPLEPFNETTVDAQSDLTQYVLEMNQGWFARNGVTVGMEIRTEKGSLSKTFFRR